MCMYSTPNTMQPVQLYYTQSRKIDAVPIATCRVFKNLTHIIMFFLISVCRLLLPPFCPSSLVASNGSGFQADCSHDMEIPVAQSLGKTSSSPNTKAIL